MFQGSEHVAPREHSELIGSVGGRAFGTTIEDQNRFYQTVPAHRYNLALWLEAERLRSLDLSDEKIRLQRSAVRDEKLESIDNQPFQSAFWRSRSQPYDERCFGYAHHVMGDVDELERASLDDVRDFYERYYRPANATLVMVGSFRSEEARGLIQDYFGDIPGGEAAGPFECSVDFAPGISIEAVHDPLAPTAAVYWSYRVPPAASSVDPALGLLSDMLVAGGRLQASLVRAGGPASQVTGWHDRRRGPGLLWFQAVARGGVTADSLAAAIRQTMADVASGPPGEAALERAKVRGRTLGAFRRRSVQAKAETLGGASVLQTLDRLPASEQAREAVTTADIADLVERYVRPENLSMVLVVPGERLARPDTFPGRPPSPLGPARALTLTPTRERLANGLQLVVVEDHEQPILVTRLYADASHLGVDQTRAGLPVLGRALDDGTTSRSREEIQEWLGERGAFYSSGTVDGAVRVSVVTRSEDAEAAVALVSETARRPALPRDGVESSRAAAVRSVRGVFSDPDGLADAYLHHRLLPPDQPGGTLPDPAAVARLTMTDIQELHRRLLVPERSVLLMAGDIGPDEARRLAEANLGDWSAGVDPPSARPNLSREERQPPGADSVLIVHHPGIAQAIVRIGATLGESVDRPALDALSQLLGTGTTGRLFNRLREERGWTYGALSRVHPRSRVFAIETSVRPSVADSVLTETARILERLRSEVVPSDELDRAKGYLVGSFAMNHETPESVGEQFVLGSLRGEEDRLARYAPSIHAVRPDDVRRVAAAVLAPDRLAVIVVGDAEDLEPLLAKHWSVRVVHPPGASGEGSQGPGS